ncbi:MAG: hypothetical protein HND44_15830 [Chloroflexi bacterium]|nr:PD40 domain-containing protein [Ardenticatenaceae bacterium]MBL1129931.1 hypothetical protein [Chloroflexota bacterium]NOG36017.1 hypothetical protein [Chloroflexota bacterium]
MKTMLLCLAVGFILALLGCTPEQTAVQVTTTHAVITSPAETPAPSPTPATETPLPPTFTAVSAILEPSQTPSSSAAPLTSTSKPVEATKVVPSPTITQAAEITPPSPLQSVADYPAFLWSPFPPSDGPGSYPPTNLYSALPVNSTEWQIEKSVADLFGSPSMIVSPDRTQVILLTVIDSNGDGEHNVFDISKIYLYAPSNGLFKEIVDNKSSVYELNWLPDSQRFVYAEDTELFSGTLDGSAPQLLASFPDLIVNIATSSNGSLTAISRFPGNLDFWNLDTGTVSQVASETTYDLRMIWSPDSRWLAFNKSVAYGLYLVDANTLAVFEIMAPVFDVAYYLSPPVWSPDSQRLAFTQNRSTLFLWDTTTQHLSEIARSNYVSEPAWSLDGQQLAFTQDDSALYFWDINMQTPREVARGAYRGLPTWSPDGMKLAIGFAGNDRSGIVIFDNSGGTLQEISINGTIEIIRTLKWSPDGNWITFLAAWNDQTGLFIVDINSNEMYMVQETTGTNEATDPFWLPLNVPNP